MEKMAQGKTMNFKEYQEACKRTAGKFLSDNEAHCNWAMGLCGESGEYSELIKKKVFHNKPLDIDSVKKELGDVFYYLSMCATVNGLSLEDIAAANVEKLKIRYPDGFVEHNKRINCF